MTVQESDGRTKDRTSEIRKILEDATPSPIHPTQEPGTTNRRIIAGFGILVLGGVALAAGQYSPDGWHWIFLFGGLLLAAVGVKMTSTPRRQTRPADNGREPSVQAGQGNERRFPRR